MRNFEVFFVPKLLLRFLFGLKILGKFTLLVLPNYFFVFLLEKGGATFLDL
jgi:hypothetical protein